MVLNTFTLSDGRLLATLQSESGKWARIFKSWPELLDWQERSNEHSTHNRLQYVRVAGEVINSWVTKNEDRLYFWSNLTPETVA